MPNPLLFPKNQEHDLTMLPALANRHGCITELGGGEALVSFLNEEGRPNIVERAFILPPASQIRSICDTECTTLIACSVVVGVYKKEVDHESAYEKIKASTAARGKEADEAMAEEQGGFSDMLGIIFGNGGSKNGNGKKTAARRSDTVLGRDHG